MHDETQNFKKLIQLLYAHFQHTNRLNNRLIDYSVSQLFNNELVMLAREGARTRSIAPEHFLPLSLSRFKSKIKNWIEKNNYLKKNNPDYGTDM